MKKIGITTTVPSEILFTAGYIPVDLNNLFIGSNNYDKYIELAEKDGFPANICAWIKGIYGACIENGITSIVGVMSGDCKNTEVLVEVLETKGIKVYPFLYPHSHDIKDLKIELDKFMRLFDVTLEEVEKTRIKLNKVRSLAKKIDDLTYKDNKATGFENHLYQIMLSDFNGDF
ncbi:MAG: 2-hydroxyacyl-CoA dehydratase family protein, partial [Fusobacteriota bacterium]